MRFMIPFGLLCICLKFSISKRFLKSYMGKDDDNVKENYMADQFPLTKNV